ncbi:glycosyltransferase [Nocardioides sp. dk4132]|uniref:glycosyltransferase n=1 Tax=unclassified Nocardioides TaxID=2615069 RepID=UPI0012961AD9|nr:MULTISPECIES: glycosyltransferase family 2 protein [unclassified Nocardioides]MQW74788.1 glycosyltransferase [Nocardioides sp. dk4132]QGA06682.1 glycosyltransferase [Nocardioides sp. dk884]
MRDGDATVLVTVVTYNSAALLPGLLESLPAALHPVPWRLAVADNDSHDDSLTVLRELAPDAVVVEMGRNAGYAAGINAAVAAGGPHTAVLVLNPDVRLDPGCGPALLAALREPGVGVAVPLLRDANGERIDSLRREPTVLRTWADAVIGAERAGRLGRLGETVTDAARYRDACDTAWAEGSVQLVDAACWARVGGWDESFFLYSEETDFHLRVGDAGRAVRFVPTARATHLEGDSGVSPRLWPLLLANRVRLARRRGGRRAACAVWAALVLRETSRACLGRPTARAAVRVLLSPRLLRRPAGPDWVA